MSVLKCELWSIKQAAKSRQDSDYQMTCARVTPIAAATPFPFNQTLLFSWPL